MKLQLLVCIVGLLVGVSVVAMGARFLLSIPQYHKLRNADGFVWDCTASYYEGFTSFVVRDCTEEERK